MARLKQLGKPNKGTLAASTVIEVIVASVLFLTVFFLAMEMLVRIGSRQADETLLQAEIDRTACVQEFRTAAFDPGEYTREYDWGVIEIIVKQYWGLNDIQEIRFTIRIEKGRQTFAYRILKPIEP